MAVKRTRSSILADKSYTGLNGFVANGSLDTQQALVGEVRNNYLGVNVGKRFNNTTGLYYRQDVFTPSSRTDTVIKTWTRPKNVKWVEVLLIGGGGSGGSGRASQGNSASGGGGAGTLLYTKVYVADYDTWYIKCGLGAGRNSLNQNSSNFNSWGKPGTSSIFSPIPIIWNFEYETLADGLDDTSTLSGNRPSSLINNTAGALAVRGARYHGLHVPGGGGGGHPAGGIGQPLGCEGGTSRGRRNKLLSSNDTPLSDGRFSRDNVFYGPGAYGGLGSSGDPASQSNIMGGGGGGGAIERGRQGDTGQGGRGGRGAGWLGINGGGGGGGGRNAGNAGNNAGQAPSGANFGGGTGGGTGGDGVNGTGGGGGGASNGTPGRGGHGAVVIRYWV